MELKDIDFIDSTLLNINISYNKIEISIRLDDGKDSEITLVCYDVVGIDKLVIWDDTNIFRLKIVNADENSDYMKEVAKAYPNNIDYGGRLITDQIKDLQITLSNDITFHIYCQAIFISDKVMQKSLVDFFLSQIYGSVQDDFWYDVKLDDLEKLLRQFTPSDWKKLVAKLPLKNKNDNTCILDCLEMFDNDYAKQGIKKIKN